MAEPGSRLGLWVNALESSEAVKNTVSSADLYLDSYERYAGTSRGSPSALLDTKRFSNQCEEKSRRCWNK